MTDIAKDAQLLKVCIDARLISGTAGGVEQFIIGLAYGLSQLTDGQEEYYFLTYSDAADWITPHLSGSCRPLYCSKAPRASSLRNLLRNNVPRTYSLVQKLYPVSERWKMSNLWSDGTIEKANIDVMHFTHQIAFLTKVPSIYHPHDLQHKHNPQYFAMSRRLIREIICRTFCSRAITVAVASSWIKSDVMQAYHLAKKKVQVIPLAPAIAANEEPGPADLSFFQQKFLLPDSFILYPAQTWPHKNHLALLEAIANIRERYGMIISAVFTGTVYEPFFPRIEKEIQKLHLEKQIRFLGFVTPLELQCLYRLAKCVVIPTKYEAGSFPLWEAFLSGVPTACSNVTSLPAQAGDAALVFDPDQPDEIVNAIMSLWTDESLRQTLIERGKKNVAQYSWELTARTFRAHYRRIAQRALSEEDRTHLNRLPLI
jgi:glycosyltransferase involved in cell wall biosynthesis